MNLLLVGFILGFAAAVGLWAIINRPPKSKRRRRRDTRPRRIPGGTAALPKGRYQTEHESIQKEETQTIPPVQEMPPEPITIPDESVSLSPVVEKVETVIPSAPAFPKSASMNPLGDFQACGHLAVQFTYSFPDKVMFFPGEGYLVDRSCRLVPDEKQFRMCNDTFGYLHSGLFRVFDIEIDGKDYTFQDIAHGKIPRTFVQPERVVEPAQLEAPDGPEWFRLKKPGKLVISVLHAE